MPDSFVDDKAPICVSFILDHLKAHLTEYNSRASRRPLVVGLNGVQGVGKTTLVVALTTALAEHNVRSVVCSIDDFYLTHRDQVNLSKSHPDNALVQHRGEPGTHDISLLRSVLATLVEKRSTKIPQYDKAAFSGQGDRLPHSQWLEVEQDDQDSVDVVILEGWCVGFRALPDDLILSKWESPSRTLGAHSVDHLHFINKKLADYDIITNLFDIFIHIDAEENDYVYAWRQQQEEHLRELRGDASAGMTKDQVSKFVDSYFPGYELYTEGVRNGVIKNKPDCQLHLIVGRDRQVKHVLRI